MVRTRVFLAALGLGLGIAATARAQNEGLYTVVDNSSSYYGPGATVGGDYARGMGALYDGVGQYNYDTARANAINMSTLMQYNEYVYACRKNWNLERLQRVHAKAEKNKMAFAATQQQIRENPGETDIVEGDALNLILEDISAILLGPSVTSYATRSFEGAMVPRIPFQISTLGGIVSLRRLLVEDGWPLALRDKAFDAERSAYKTAVENLLEHAHEGKLTVADVKAVQQAIDRLTARAQPVLAKSDPTLKRETREFLNGLAMQARCLQSASVETMIVEIDRYAGTTVGEFIEFMQRFNLQFGPAKTPAERDLYNKLYVILKQEQIALAGGMMPSNPPSLPPGADAASLPPQLRDAAQKLPQVPNAGLQANPPAAIR